MPNHVNNVLKFKDVPEEKMKKIAERIKGEETVFDFNKIIYMPKLLEEIKDGCQDLAVRCWMADGDYDAYKLKKECNLTDNDFEKLKELGNKYATNKLIYGYSSWYHWSIKNWGTKWNAWNCEWADNELVFYTAWNAPEPVIETLAVMFDDITFEHHYADEDIGSNCGIVTYENGQKTLEWYPGDKEGRMFALKLWGREGVEEE